jgi:transporter family protein
MGWLAFSLVAMGLWGVWGFLSKVATQQLPPQAVYLLAICGHGAVVGYLWLGRGLAIPWQPWGLTAGLAAGVCMAFGLLCFFRALAGGTAAVVVPLTAFYPLVTVILCWLLLREGINLRQFVGVILALVAVWLLSI